ncbi:hypothetical protein pclt_cds_140 [Pandoravirus celtis]|uniref:Uncharacterized protein n=1 Tax=Pandoravirus celtis TaxID=2568002 RepID=A0A4D6EGR0_9VIRU|nr:hypothetical protein pclt_cds_140 [Pandoravirus celtis]
MEEPEWPSRRRPRAETPTQPDVEEPPRRRPRIDYQQRFGLVLGRPAPTMGTTETSEVMRPPRETAPPTPSLPIDEWSLVEALPREVLVELLERMLVLGRGAQVIGLCGSNRDIQHICQETTINARALGLPLAANRYSIINAARALAFAIYARRCILWAWLLAAQRIVDVNAQRGPRMPAQRERIGQRLNELAEHVNLDRVSYNDLLLWATSHSPNTMPRKAQHIVDSDRTRPYLWRQLIARAYGVPTGPTPYGMASLLYADPSDPQSTLVALDSGSDPLPSHATLLDEVGTNDAIRAGWLPANFLRLGPDQRQALVQTPEYATHARERIVGALDQALRDAERARSAAQPGQTPDSARLTEPDCARRLFDLFDVRVFVAPGRLRLSHYAAIRLRPADVWPFDPTNYWTL